MKGLVIEPTMMRKKCSNSLRIMTRGLRGQRKLMVFKKAKGIAEIP